ncbi:ATPase [Thermocladium modestius]|uniref:A-type ATP synthase subunit I n=1 Tax=Thermocladium modestius TaxID=62609 RepID=A0A830GXB2_9CREN|nr:V-type ATPase 116kDa subunit family protein [Thermocladium modestius]GGP22191.1 ATPase [Thermocladium modestius]
MPIERVTEYRISVPYEAALDVIAKIGETGVFMFMPRPSEMPSPPIPQDVYDKVKYVEEAARELRQLVQEAEGKVEVYRFKSFGDMLASIYGDISNVMLRIKQFQDRVIAASTEMDRYSALLAASSALKAMPSDLKHFSAVLARVQSKDLSDLGKAIESMDAIAMEVSRDQGRASVIVLYPKWMGESVMNSLRLFNAEVMELAGIDVSRISEAASKLGREKEEAERELMEYVRREAPRIAALVELASSASDVFKTYTGNAFEEGGEFLARIDMLRASMDELRRRAEELTQVLEFLGELKRNNINSIKLGAIRYRVFLAKGEVPPELERLAGYDINMGGYYAYVAINPPAQLQVNAIEVSPDLLSDVDNGIKVVERQREETRRRVEELEDELNRLVESYNQVSNFGVDGARSIEGGRVVTLRGYVVERNAKKFEDALFKIFSVLAIDAKVRKFSKVMQVAEVNPREAPTSESYPSFVDAFKNIVYMYGVPEYKEVSPVPIAAFFFPIFFGWMFPDAGHGLLVLLMGLALYKYRYKGGNSLMRSIFGGKYSTWGLIFMMMGIMAIVFAVIYSGEFFGLDLIPTLTGLHIIELSASAGLSPSMDWIDYTFTAAILFGLMVLTFALILTVINKIRLGHVLDGMILTSTIVVFIGAALTFMSVGLVPILYPPIYDYIKSMYAVNISLFIIGMAMFGALVGYVKYKYRHERLDMGELIIAFAIEGILAALANVISFMRLGIVALVHSLLTAMSIGLVDTMGGLTNPAGFIVFVALNLLIALGEGFLTFIQGLRLHYYEMFSKFFEGLGTPFAAFKIGGRLTMIEIG